MQRAVDGIYQTCEEDESISECKEVILVLENYTRDFHNLIEWFKVKWAYESAQPPLRRVPLAWEVRKTSPGRAWGSGSSSTQKSVSPVQRSSPTIGLAGCKSPVDTHNTIVENRTIKDNENSSMTKVEIVTKNEGKNIGKDKTKCYIDKSKTGNSNRTKVGVNANKNKLSNKFCNVDIDNIVISERAANSNDSRNNVLKILDTDLLSSTTRKEVNKELLKSNQSLLNNTDDGKNIVKNCSGLTSPNGKILLQKSNKVCRPAYSAVSRMKPAINQNNSATIQNSNDTPKIVRSKTSISMKRTTNVNRTRPGTSVIVRKRLQTSGNPSCVSFFLDSLF